VVRDGRANQPLDAFDHLLAGAARVAGREVQRGEAVDRGAPGERFEDLLLVSEVVVHEGLGHAQRAHDLRHGGVRVALRREQLRGRLQDALALHVGALRGRALAAGALRQVRLRRGLALVSRGFVPCRGSYTHG